MYDVLRALFYYHVHRERGSVSQVESEGCCHSSPDQSFNYSKINLLFSYMDAKLLHLSNQLPQNH